MKVFAIVFDVDDVLIQSSDIIHERYVKVADELGLKPPTKEQHKQLLGRPIEEFNSALWPNADPDVILKTEEKYYSYKTIPAVSGAVDAIKQLKHKYRLSIVTGKPPATATPNLKDAGFDLEDFEFIQTAADTTEHKPDPRVFDKTLRMLGMPPDVVLYVGDALNDFESARDAGLQFVAVLSGWYTREEFEAAGCENIINSVAELPSFLLDDALK